MMDIEQNNILNIYIYGTNYSNSLDELNEIYEKTNLLLQNFIKYMRANGYYYRLLDIEDQLKRIYSRPCDCVGCHINAYINIIRLKLENQNEVNPIMNTIIIPTIEKILIENLIDIYDLQLKTIEYWYIEQEKKPKGVSKEIIEYFSNLKSEYKNGNECFCGDTKKSDKVIKMPCCSKKLHLFCIKKWFKTNNTCPYCRKIYD